MPWPTTRQSQCAQCGAIAWIAHSKLSKVMVLPPWVTVKALSQALPQTSHVAIGERLNLGVTLKNRPVSQGFRRLPRRPRVHRRNCLSHDLDIHALKSN